MRIKGTETFLIPCGDIIGTDRDSVSVLYSPLNDELALIDKPTADVLSKYTAGSELAADPEINEICQTFMTPEVTEISPRNVVSTRRLSIIPTLKCNFACSYCYSAKGRSQDTLSWGKAKAAIDYLFDNTKDDGTPISIFITGGGEPLSVWHLTKQILEYARHRAIYSDRSLRLSIITNGSLITEDIASTMADLNCTVGVSFEVLEDLQNQHRKHYDTVSRNIRALHNHGVNVKINSTITPQSVSRMADMTAEIIKRYPYISQFTVEPVTGANMFDSAVEIREFYDTFFNNYLKCKDMARQSGLNLRFTFDDDMRSTVNRHCPGKMCLTPSGAISVCHLVSSEREDRYAKCVYGNVSDESVNIDVDKFNELYGYNVSHYAECRDCFGKWVCGGECLTRRNTYPPEYMAEVCDFNRRCILHGLMQRIESAIKEEIGLTLQAYVEQGSC